MNQMLKKASTTCAAFVCAASLMFAGTASVWADSEIDETVKNQIESYAEGLTDEIIGLTDEQIEQYMDSDDEYTATLPVKFDKEDAEFVYVFDKNVIPTSLAVDIQYSFGTTMKNAALNTVMGLGTVFVILIFLIFLISLFKYVPGSGAQQVKKKEETTPAQAPVPVPVAVPVQEETDNSELIAVIAAAIAASEGTTTDGFVVRSIRKINRKKR